MKIEFLLILWNKFKSRIQNKPLFWSSIIFVSCFLLKLTLWKSVPNEIPLVSTAIAIISLAAGIRYGLFFSIPAFVAEFYYFSPDNFLNSLSDPNVILNLFSYAVVLIFIALSFGSQHAIEAEMNLNLEKQKKWIRIASHELKTPLNGILGINRILKKKMHEIDNLKYLDLIEKSTWHLNKIVTDLLDLSKLSSSDITIENEVFSISEQIEMACQILNVQAEEKGLFLAVHDSCQNLIVRGDKVKFQQVLNNLIENAVKYTARGGVTVKSQHVDDLGFTEIVIKVQDTGIGVASEEFEQIFNPFYRVNDVNSAHVNGSGLGLAISRKIIDQLGGTIGLESKIGKGSEFWFKLKFETVIETKESVYQPNMLASKTKLPKALVAEDNDINRIVIARDLKDLNIEMEIVTDGEQAIERCRIANYDLILLDCQMPNINGFEAAVQIREIMTKRALKTPPIIGFTADTTEYCRESALKSGMDFLIYKPFRIHELKELLSDILPNGLVNSHVDINAMFESELPGRLAELQKLARNSNWLQLKQKTHYLKSSCLAINNLASAKICEDMEFLCELQDTDLVLEKMNQLENSLEA